MRTPRRVLLTVLRDEHLYELAEGHRVYYVREGRRAAIVERFTKKRILIRLPNGEKKWVCSKSLLPRYAKDRRVD